MRVAAIQHSFKGNKEATINKTLELIKEAKNSAAELIVLQELHSQEYFCQSEDTRYFDYAKSFSKDVEFWSKVSKENDIVLVTSLFEDNE